MIRNRSSSPTVSATVSAMAPLWASGGHFYFGQTGHLHFGPTDECPGSEVMSAPREKGCCHGFYEAAPRVNVSSTRLSPHPLSVVAGEIAAASLASVYPRSNRWRPLVSPAQWGSRQERDAIYLSVRARHQRGHRVSRPFRCDSPQGSRPSAVSMPLRHHVDADGLVHGPIAPDRVENAREPPRQRDHRAQPPAPSGEPLHPRPQDRPRRRPTA